MLEEINRGEKAAIEEYNEIISENEIPASTKELLIEQRNAIQTALNNIKRFEPIVS